MVKFTYPQFAVLYALVVLNLFTWAIVAILYSQLIH